MNNPIPSKISVDAALNAFDKRRVDQVVVSTMTVMKPWREQFESDRDLFCVGFMGGASTFGLGATAFS